MKKILNQAARSVIETVAPTIGTALGGPMGGVAAQYLSNRLLGKGTHTVEELQEAILHASPDQLADIKRIEADFKVQMERIGVDLEEIAAKDRDSARNREIALNDKTPAILAYGTMAAFFGYIGGVTFLSTPDTDMDFIYLALGWLGGTASTVIAYYFGSSSGSAKKDNVISKLK